MRSLLYLIINHPDNWTNSGMPEKRRYFMMGNALVCGIINKISKELITIIDNEE